MTFDIQSKLYIYTCVCVCVLKYDRTHVNCFYYISFYFFDPETKPSIVIYIYTHTLRERDRKRFEFLNHNKPLQVEQHFRLTFRDAKFATIVKTEKKTINSRNIYIYIYNV